MCVCDKVVCVKDGVCESGVCVCVNAASFRAFFAPALQCHLLGIRNRKSTWPQSTSLTAVVTQNETFIAVVRKCKTPQNMHGVQARH